VIDLEAFLAQAIQQRKLEAKLTRYALKQLREALGWVRGQIDVYGLNGITPNRAARIQELRAAVEAYMAQSYATPLMETIQASPIVEEFIDKQLDFARQVVATSGGTTTGALSANVVIPKVMGKVMLNGVPWGEVLTERLPKSVADRLAKAVGLMPSDVGRVFGDAVVKATERHVEAIITSGIQDAGGFAQQLLWQIETSPAWQEDNKLVWAALLDSSTCAVCMRLDGKRFPIDYEIQRPHVGCRCAVLPESFFAGQRSALNDKEDLVAIGTTKKATEDWLRSNPETARAILGKKRAERFISGEIGLDRAINEKAATIT